VVKPVVGLTEGVTAVVQSVSNSTDLKAGNARVNQVRARRALATSVEAFEGNGSTCASRLRLVLAPFESDAALAQSLVVNEDPSNGSSSSPDSPLSPTSPTSPSSPSNGHHSSAKDLYVGHAATPHPSNPRLRVLVVVSLQKLLLRVEVDPVFELRKQQQRQQQRQLLQEQQQQGAQTNTSALGSRVLAASAAADDLSEATARPVAVSFAWGQIAHCLPKTTQGSQLVGAAAAASGGGVDNSDAKSGGGAGVEVTLYSKEPRLASLLGLETSQGACKFFLACPRSGGAVDGAGRSVASSLGSSSSSSGGGALAVGEGFLRLYSLLWSRRGVMGDARSMPEPAAAAAAGSVGGRPEKRSSSGDAAGGAAGGAAAPRSSPTYAFGSAQKEVFAAVGAAAEQVTAREASMTEMAILEAFQSVLVAARPRATDWASGVFGVTSSCSTVEDNPSSRALLGSAEEQDERRRLLDEGLWHLTRRWQGTHRNLSSKKLCVLLLLNESNATVQVGEANLRVGQACHTVSDLLHAGGTFDRASRSLQPGGALAVCAWSFGPNPFKKQHVLVTLDTAAVSVSASDMKSKCGCGTAKGAFSAGLLENAAGGGARDWARVVVSVGSRFEAHTDGTNH